MNKWILQELTSLDSQRMRSSRCGVYASTTLVSQTIVNNFGVARVWMCRRLHFMALCHTRTPESSETTSQWKQKKREVKPLASSALYGSRSKRSFDSNVTHLLPVVIADVIEKNNVKNVVITQIFNSKAGDGVWVKQHGPLLCLYVFYMSELAGCRWVQAVGLTPLASHRTSLPPSLVTMEPHSHGLAVRPSSCRFGCRFAILVFGHCVFREQVMSHSACSSAWTRGNPGNSGCRSKTAAGLAVVWP